MSDQPKDGGPAFPNPALADPEYRPQPGDGGMNLRDWFAGQSLAWAGHGEWFSSDPKHVAERAYKMADAMLAARVQP